MLSSSNRFDDGWRIVTSDILVCKSCGKFHDGFPQAFVRPENKKKCDCGFITSNELGNDIVWHLERASEDGWTMWFDLYSQQTRVWDSSFPSLDENGLISDDWDKSFSSGKAAWDYVKSLT